MLSRVGEWALAVVEGFGYPGLAAVILLETVFPPVPSELILPLAGFLAASGRLSWAGVVAASTAGAVVGAWILYLAGASWGEPRLRAITRRYGRYAAVHERDLDAALRWFRRWGPAAVFICRMIPLLRSIISLPAGLVGMRWGRFTVLTAAGTLLWNTVLSGFGYAAGAHWAKISAMLKAYERLVLVALVIGAIIWWARGRRTRR